MKEAQKSIFSGLANKRGGGVLGALTKKKMRCKGSGGANKRGGGVLRAVTNKKNAL